MPKHYIHIFIGACIIIAVLFATLYERVEAVKIFVGGKIIRKDKISRLLGRAIRGVNVVGLFTVETSRFEGGQTQTGREKFFIAGAVLGNCQVGKHILGISAASIRGIKVVTAGMCK